MKKTNVFLSFFIICSIVIFSSNIKKAASFSGTNKRGFNGDFLNPTNPIDLGSNPLLLNNMTEVSISAGQTRYFVYTPHDTTLYCFETFGNQDTVLEANDSINSVSDDNSGVDYNSCIYFESTPYYPITIRVRLKSTISSGTISLQVRKSTFSMFAYSGGGLNTISDLTTPAALFSSYLNCKTYANVDSSFAIQNDERNLSKINSEILFYSGHGRSDSLVFYSEGIRSYISTNNIFDLSQLQVAVLSSCNSGYEDEDNPISIARHLVNSGAKSSIGFSKTINCKSATAFTNHFFNRLFNRGSIKESAEYASWHILWPFDSVKDYIIFGDDSMVAAIPSVTNIIFNEQINHIDPYLLTMINEDFVGYSISNNINVFYQTINDYLSSNVIVLEYDNDDTLISTINGTQTITNILGINDYYLNQPINSSITHNGETLILNGIENRIVVYYNFNGNMTPVEITQSTYHNGNNDLFMIYNCLNLYNGNIVDYDSISSIVENVGSGNVSA